jgi:glycyl-tRNA synthetase beta chain
VPELLLELLTEEIPARMQARAAEDLCRLVGAALGPIAQGAPRGFSGPRRIGLMMEVAARAETAAREERGPRVSAPEAALNGFLKKHGASREALSQQGEFWVLTQPGTSMEAAALVRRVLPGILWSFPWPKSMRWGVSAFTWVRPLQRILCLLDGAVAQFDLSKGEDAAHGLVSGNLTEGHRVHASGAFAVSSCADFMTKLREHFVIIDSVERLSIIRDGIAALAAAERLEPVPDEGLQAEVCGLVEWPVPLLGSIDPTFMDLPPEVMRTSMRVNQRFFALRTPDGTAAPRFALVANIAASDGGVALVAGNERVLRARLSDARFFWDQDRKIPLEALLPRLDGVVFHARLGTQGARVRRLERLAEQIAPLVGADPALAARAGRLCKADLASGMVGEFPELQGVMGGYYALAAGENAQVARAVANHYRPAGPADSLPAEPTTIAIALADKFDQMAGFFGIGEKPSGSGDPFALRRAGLGVIRLLRERALHVPLRAVISMARQPFECGDVSRTAGDLSPKDVETEVLEFLFDRLRVQLRSEGARADIISAAIGMDDDILRILSRAEALRTLVESETGQALLAAYKRAQNILRIEDKKDGPHFGPLDGALALSAETDLLDALELVQPQVTERLAIEDFAAAAAALASLRPPIDAFFQHVLVNDPDPTLRKNRLRLLSRLKSAMDSIADLSKIEA